MNAKLTFVECDTCRETAGFMRLCSGCYHNRSAIHSAGNPRKANSTVDPFNPTFKECDTCAANNSATFCGGCRHNRATIELIHDRLKGAASADFNLWDSMDDAQRYEDWKQLRAAKPTDTPCGVCGAATVVQVCAVCVHNSAVIARLAIEMGLKQFIVDVRTTRAFEVLQQAKLERYEHGGGRLMIEGTITNNYATREVVADFFNQDTRDLIMSLIEAVVKPTSRASRFHEAMRLLLQCHDHAYNPFEPENQSDEYKRLHSFLFNPDMGVNEDDTHKAVREAAERVVSKGTHGITKYGQLKQDLQTLVNAALFGG